jgi:uncharacterized 2Fe-2S/4Fe-4S cluster protein (DUF4445 family)
MSEVKVSVGERLVLTARVGDSLGAVLARHNLISLPCGGQGICGLCRVKIREGPVTPPTKYERLLGYTGSMRLACQTVILGDLRVELSPGLPKPVRLNTLLVNPRKINPLISTQGSGVEELFDHKINVGEDARVLLLDLGTTKIAYQVVSPRGDVLFEDSVFTPLSDFGLDIISRLARALEDKRVKDEIYSRLRSVVYEISNNHSTNLILVGGNSVMESFFFNLDLKGLAEYPFRPATNDVVVDKVGDKLFIGMPMIAGFLGGDAYADLIASFQLNIDKPYLLIDIGTNTEIFLVKDEEVYATSTPSGPAFETGISRGSTVFQGGIFRARIAGVKDEKPVFQYSYLGAPTGILGPALISILADLRRGGFIDEGGRIVRGYKTLSGLKILYIDESRDLYISQVDVRNIQKAIAAVKSGVRILMREAGVSKNALKGLVIGGNFGVNLDIEDAMSLGLIPSVEKDIVVAAGNLVLPGLRVALLNRDYLFNYKTILEKVKTIDLPKMPGYMDLWVDSLHLTPL